MLQLIYESLSQVLASSQRLAVNFYKTACAPGAFGAYEP